MKNLAFMIVALFSINALAGYEISGPTNKIVTVTDGEAKTLVDNLRSGLQQTGDIRVDMLDCQTEMSPTSCGVRPVGGEQVYVGRPNAEGILKIFESARGLVFTSNHLNALNGDMVILKLLVCDDTQCVLDFSAPTGHAL